MFGAFDSIELAGASKNIASPTHAADKHTILENIKVAVDLHKAETLVLTNHLDCGAYGGSAHFRSYDEEIAFHRKELETAKQITHKIFPHLHIQTFFLTKDERGAVQLI